MGVVGATRRVEEEAEGVQRPRLSGGGRMTKRDGEQAWWGPGRSIFISSKARLRGLSVATPDMM